MVNSSQPRNLELSRTQAKATRPESNSNLKKVTSKGENVSTESLEFEAELQSELETNALNSNGENLSNQKSLENNQLLNSLIQNNTSEGIPSQKMDSVLVNEIQSIIAPESTNIIETTTQINEDQIIQLANSQSTDEQSLELKTQFEQLLSKAPVKEAQSSSAGLENAELDPALMSNEDFVLQKNLFTKKQVPNPYGLKGIQGNQQKVAIESGLKDTQVVKEVLSTEGNSINSQQFILGLQQKDSQNIQLNETQSSPKVFDLSSVKSGNTNEIMNQITDYVIQAKAAKEPTVNMRLNHEDLGLIDITVSKSGLSQDSIAVNIGTHSLDAKNFFQINTKELFSHLNTAGLNVTDLKVETSGQTAKNDFDFGSQSGKNQQGSEKQFGSEQNQRRHESERRQDLWKLLNKEAA